MNCPEARLMQRATTYAKRSFTQFQRKSTSAVSARLIVWQSRRGSHKPTKSTAKSRPIPKSVHTKAAATINPHNYTSGRWLRRDRVELESRYIKFNFHALCDRVLELCPGASSIKSCVKKEGNYNRVFIFTGDTSQRVVARLPTSVSGPAKFTTNSEVATISYIQANTSVPIPKILDWNDNASYPIGSEYIIMKEATGTQLAQAWPEMAGEQQISCIRSIYTYIRQVAQLEFPAYGSLYFSSLPLDCTYEIPSAPEFCVGPHCGAMFCNCNPIEPRYYHSVKANRGPWSTFTDFCDSLIDSGISRLPFHNNSYRKRPKFHGSIADHLRLLEYSRDVLKNIAELWRQTKAAHTEMFKEVSRAILENQESEDEQLSHEELLAIWPFDIGEQDERSYSKNVEK